MTPQPPSNPEDPGWLFIEAFRSGDLPDDLVGLAEAVEGALQTEEVSMGLAALAWRVLTEAALDGPPVAQRGELEQAALSRAMSALGRSARSWRAQTFSGRLDPYLARGGHQRYHFEMCKSMPRPPRWLGLARDTAEERWAGAVSAEWLDQHPWGEGMELQVGDRTVGIADTVRLEAEVEVEVGWGSRRIPGVALPAGMTLTFGDLLRLAHPTRPAPRRRGRARFEAGTPSPLDLIDARARGDTDWLADFWLF